MSDKAEVKFWHSEPAAIYCSRGYYVEAADRWKSRIVYFDGEHKGQSAIVPKDSYLADNQIALEIWRVKEWEAPKGGLLSDADRNRLREDLRAAYEFDKWNVLIDSEFK